MEVDILYFWNLILRLAFLCNNFVVKVYRGRYIIFLEFECYFVVKVYDNRYIVFMEFECY